MTYKEQFLEVFRSTFNIGYHIMGAVTLAALLWILISFLTHKKTSKKTLINLLIFILGTILSLTPFLLADTLLFISTRSFDLNLLPVQEEPKNIFQALVQFTYLGYIITAGFIFTGWLLILSSFFSKLRYVAIATFGVTLVFFIIQIIRVAVITH
ncbi:hypothetical protein KKC94_04150 [Patescibacteria group bacterium]|nr:hypothetical protein [Patescibacteria group bacterium]